jgi:signal peptidase II
MVLVRVARRSLEWFSRLAGFGAMARRIGLFSLLLLVLALVGCDHATKAVAEAELSRSAPMALVPGFLELRYVENDDTAFSLTRSITSRLKAPLLAVGSLLGLLGVATVVKRKLPAARSSERIALALMAAGGIANVADRLRRGYVVDFIYLHHWPVFNVADVLIVVGLGWLAAVAGRDRLRAARSP